MSENTLVGIGCLGFLGIPTLVFWALAMFTDTQAGRFYDSLSDVKNGTAFFAPVGGLAFTIIGIVMLSEPLFPGAENARIAASIFAGLLLILGLVFRFPIPLPRWMYPQWHAERRLERRRAALAAASSSTTSSANKDPQPPATIPAPPQQTDPAQEPPSRSPGEGQTA
ncbi:hypothetical protein D4740_12055 [Actinomyces sp. 2119]|uniref:hypothetical protein n=1 Tax=Actinomyces sp. 2119 TaxID=2321393 RepID=UPI000E6D45DE|nr:hypothetical protein [Actinomyces sp. 2119]RJF40385.1 hypothetical protein D4740_12055 [Actinomyces sp. 2119]